MEALQKESKKALYDFLSKNEGGIQIYDDLLAAGCRYCQMLCLNLLLMLPISIFFGVSVSDERSWMK
jgi:hypothetical protein